MGGGLTQCLVSPHHSRGDPKATGPQKLDNEIASGGLAIVSCLRNANTGGSIDIPQGHENFVLEAAACPRAIACRSASSIPILIGITLVSALVLLCIGSPSTLFTLTLLGKCHISTGFDRF